MTKHVVSAATQESKRDKFMRLAIKRVNAAINKIGVIENLANKGSYDFTEADMTKINTALLNAVAKVTEAFGAALQGKTKSTSSFGLSEGE